MRIAVVDQATGAVQNVIRANVRDKAPTGTHLVVVPLGEAIDARWFWNEEDGFYPSPELEAELAAEVADLEAEAEDWEDVP